MAPTAKYRREKKSSRSSSGKLWEFLTAFTDRSQKHLTSSADADYNLWCVRVLLRFLQAPLVEHCSEAQANLPWASLRRSPARYHQLLLSYLRTYAREFIAALEAFAANSCKVSVLYWGRRISLNGSRAKGSHTRHISAASNTWVDAFSKMEIHRKTTHLSKHQVQ